MRWGVSSKFRRLLTDLRDATAEGRLQWSDTADEEMFRMILPHGMVRIGRRSDDLSEGTMSYFALLLTPQGGLVEEATADEVTGETILPELYALARRSARNGDELLDQMIADLESRKLQNTR